MNRSTPTKFKSMDSNSKKCRLRIWINQYISMWLLCYGKIRCLIRLGEDQVSSSPKTYFSLALITSTTLLFSKCKLN